MNSPRRVPEVLAPAGDLACLRAAIDGGADAVYFGLRDFNARARAENFGLSDLPEVMRELREHGVRGYVTLNTLLFDDELASFSESVRACADAGVDAIIVQDLGAVALARKIAPGLAVHASTQATVTDSASCAFVHELGAERAILARELSVEDIASITAAAPIPTEVFVHGALCVAYSGQCLTSEAIGGRSANRGACAQACRLPYELIVDGELRDTSGRAFLLSPQDLDASDLVPELDVAGVSSLKIEGRLKSPEYVFATSRLYRERVDALAARSATHDPQDDGAREAARVRALSMFTRGSSPAFLKGTNHQALVEGTSSDHRGLALGVLMGTSEGSRTDELWLDIALTAPLRRGDGLLVEGGFASKGEVGGRVWNIRYNDRDTEEVPAGVNARVWLGPDVRVSKHVATHSRVWKTNDPQAFKDINAERRDHAHRVALDLVLEGAIGEPASLSGTTARGRTAKVVGTRALEKARTPATPEAMRIKFDRLGDTPFSLRDLKLALPADAFLPPSEINELRRALVLRLTTDDAATASSAPGVSFAEASSVLGALPETSVHPADAKPQLVVLARTREQAFAAVDAGADEVILDFLELTGTGAAFRELSPRARMGVAPPRIRKPGEEKIDRFLDSLEPKVRLVRSLGAVAEGRNGDSIRVGDFSLNVTNRLTASILLARGLDYFTPSYDLNSAQLSALLDESLAPFAEVVLHTPMPLFHMEHCVYAHLLSEGADYKTCGRPCDRHALSLRDRAGFDHPVVADVGCRNTVFHARAQSAADSALHLLERGVRRFRIELVREDAATTEKLVHAYRELLSGITPPRDVWTALRADVGYGVVRGSLRVLS